MLKAIHAQEDRAGRSRWEISADAGCGALAAHSWLEVGYATLPEYARMKWIAAPTHE